MTAYTTTCCRNRCVGGNFQLRSATNSKKLTFTICVTNVVMHWNNACSPFSTTKDGMITLQLTTCLVFWFGFERKVQALLFSIVQSSFSQTHKVGNVGIIANFVFLLIGSFLLYFYHLMHVNVKLEIKGYKRITFQGYTFYWTC